MRSKRLSSFLSAWRTFYNPLELVVCQWWVFQTLVFLWEALIIFSILEAITCCWIVVHSVFALFSPTAFWWGKNVAQFSFSGSQSLLRRRCQSHLLWAVHFSLASFSWFSQTFGLSLCPLDVFCKVLTDLLELQVSAFMKTVLPSFLSDVFPSPPPPPSWDPLGARLQCRSHCLGLPLWKF